MKFIAILYVIAVVVTQVYSADDAKPDPIKQFNTECQKLSQIDDATLEDICQGNITDDPKVRAHLYCFSKKMGFQNEKGELQLEGMRKGLTDYVVQHLNKLITGCFVPKATPEESAFEALKCVHKHKPQDSSVFN